MNIKKIIKRSEYRISFAGFQLLMAVMFGFQAATDTGLFHTLDVIGVPLFLFGGLLGLVCWVMDAKRISKVIG